MPPWPPLPAPLLVALGLTGDPASGPAPVAPAPETGDTGLVAGAVDSADTAGRRTPAETGHTGAPLATGDTGGLATPATTGDTGAPLTTGGTAGPGPAETAHTGAPASTGDTGDAESGDTAGKLGPCLCACDTLEGSVGLPLLLPGLALLGRRRSRREIVSKLTVDGVLPADVAARLRSSPEE